MEKSTYWVLIFMLIFLIHGVNTRKTGQLEAIKGNKFVLVHGTCHGAWTWYKIVQLLDSSGYDVTALDLGASGINPLQANEIPLPTDYFKPLIDFLASLPPHKKVILVAHSSGGYAAAHVMEKFPDKISAAVFVTAFMPGLDLNITAINTEEAIYRGDQLDNQYTYDDGPDNFPTSLLYGPQYMAEQVYQRSPAEDLALAKMLVRPRRLYSTEAMSKELNLSSSNYGSIRRAYIVTTEDLVIPQAYQEWMIEKNPTDEVVVINGADHMVMMSKPLELSLNLLRIADKST